MTVIDPISAVNVANTEQTSGLSGGGKVDSSNFADWLNRELAVTNVKINEADQAVRELAVGEAENLHQVMIALSKAEISFDLLTQVRNRLLEGFQEIIRMQV